MFIGQNSNVLSATATYDGESRPCSRIRKTGLLALAVGCAVMAATSAQADTVAGSKAALNVVPVSDTINSAIVTSIIPALGTATSLSFQIQDSTGATEVFAMPKTTYTPTVGDIIDLTGLSESFHGLYELHSPYTVILDSTGNATPALTTFTTAEFQSSFGASLQSFIGTLDDVTFVSPPATFASNQTLTVTDGTLLATVFIPSANPLIGSAIPTGPVNITGYYSEFDAAPAANTPPDNTGHEFDPLSIVAVPEPTSMGLLGLAGVSLLRRCRRQGPAH